jgi:hypothetical protein
MPIPDLRNSVLRSCILIGDVDKMKSLIPLISTNNQNGNEGINDPPKGGELIPFQFHLRPQNQPTGGD